jgi:hypothetical protein
VEQRRTGVGTGRVEGIAHAGFGTANLVHHSGSTIVPNMARKSSGSGPPPSLASDLLMSPHDLDAPRNQAEPLRYENQVLFGQ